MGILKCVTLLSLVASFHLSATEISLKDFENIKTVHLENNKESQKKLLYFWASWCPDCRGKLRSELRDLKKQNVDVVTVNLDRNLKKGMNFIKQENLPFTVLRDEEKFLRKTLSVYAVPSWAVIEKKNEKWSVVKSSSGSDIKKIKESLGVL
ncbi:MAG: TlpA family protein disulfide reductase [Bacteriovoracaceae bacterium]